MTDSKYQSPTPIIAPSVLAADFADLKGELNAISTADWVHVDVMDGHFVPNLSFGPDISRTISKHTHLPLDVHLMIEDPERWVGKYTDFAHTVIFHLEATDNPVRLARRLRDEGVRPGFSLKPATSLDPWLEHLHNFDEVLVMSVEPGFGGQKFMPEQLDKVRQLADYRAQAGLDFTIEIDGGIGPDTIAAASAAGCDAFVAGSAVFGVTDRAGRIQELRDIAVKARN